MRARSSNNNVINVRSVCVGRGSILRVVLQQLEELLALDSRRVLDRNRSALRNDLRSGIRALHLREAGSLGKHIVIVSTGNHGCSMEMGSEP